MYEGTEEDLNKTRDAIPDALKINVNFLILDEADYNDCFGNTSIYAQFTEKSETKYKDAFTYSNVTFNVHFGKDYYVLLGYEKRSSDTIFVLADAIDSFLSDRFGDSYTKDEDKRNELLDDINSDTSDDIVDLLLPYIPDKYISKDANDFAKKCLEVYYGNN